MSSLTPLTIVAFYSEWQMSVCSCLPALCIPLGQKLIYSWIYIGQSSWHCRHLWQVILYFPQLNLWTVSLWLSGSLASSLVGSMGGRKLKDARKEETRNYSLLPWVLWYGNDYNSCHRAAAGVSGTSTVSPSVVWHPCSLSSPHPTSANICDI